MRDIARGLLRWLYGLRLAPVTLAVVAVTALAFVVEEASGRWMYTDRLTQWIGFSPVRVEHGQWWRFPGSQLVNPPMWSMARHISAPEHFLTNMLALLLVGPFLERALGGARYLSVYAVGGVCSQIGFLVLFPHGIGVGGGSSGGVAAVIGAAVVTGRATRRNSAAAERTARRLTTLFVVLAVVSLRFSPVTNAIHLSGALTGGILGTVYYLARQRRRLPSPRPAG